MDILYGYLLGIGYASLCLLISLIIYKCGVSKKITRKVVHILVGFEWVILYHFFGAGLHFLAVCVFFLALLSLAYKFKLMPMISSDKDNAPGTVYYAVAMTGVAIVGCFVPDVMIPFGVGIFCTSIGDGFAGVVGQLVKKNNPKIYNNKTLFGTITNALFSFASVLVMELIFDMALSVWQMILIAFLSVSLELVTGKGLDNITITWGVTALTYGFVYYSAINFLIVPILCTPWFIGLCLQKKVLTKGGVLLAVVFDIIISLTLGNFGFTLLAIFLVLSVVVDKFKRQIIKRGRNDEAEKSDCRDYMQVIANGLIATICAVLYFASKDRVYIIAFSAALAEALADTVSSGIGIVSNKTYDIFRLKKCDGGISGGMSLIGTFSSLVASYLISLIAFLYGVVNIYEVIIITGAGFLGGVFDSFLGSLLQAKFKCKKCGKITEKSNHCTVSTVYYSGISFIDNDCVNILSGFFSAALSFALFYTLL